MRLWTKNQNSSRCDELLRNQSKTIPLNKFRLKKSSYQQRTNLNVVSMCMWNSMRSIWNTKILNLFLFNIVRLSSEIGNFFGENSLRRSLYFQSWFLKSLSHHEVFRLFRQWLLQCSFFLWNLETYYLFYYFNFNYLFILFLFLSSFYFSVFALGAATGIPAFIELILSRYFTILTYPSRGSIVISEPCLCHFFRVFTFPLHWWEFYIFSKWSYACAPLHVGLYYQHIKVKIVQFFSELVPPEFTKGLYTIRKHSTVVETGYSGRYLAFLVWSIILPLHKSKNCSVFVSTREDRIQYRCTYNT